MCSCSAPAPDQHDGLDSGVFYQTLTVILFGFSLASASTQHEKSVGDGGCAQFAPGPDYSIMASKLLPANHGRAKKAPAHDVIAC